MPTPDLMIVTDLDGTFLDHHDYSFDAALPMLEQLRADDVPVVFCSSKTRAEITALQARTGLDGHAFVAENGAVVVGPAGDVLVGPVDGDLERLHAALDRIRQPLQLRFETFGGVTDAVVAAWTGLDLEAAGRARRARRPRCCSGTPRTTTGPTRSARRSPRSVSTWCGAAGSGTCCRRAVDKGAAVRTPIADHERRTARSRARSDSVTARTTPRCSTRSTSPSWSAGTARHPDHSPTTAPSASTARDRPGPQGWTEGLTRFTTPSVRSHR